MLDDHTGRRVETLDAFPSGIRVGDVVVTQLFALQLFGCDQGARCGVQVAVEGCALVAVLAVAQVLHFDKSTIALAGEQGQSGNRIAGRHNVTDLDGG